MEVAALHELYDWTEGIHKKVLFQVLRKYGPDKLQLWSCHSDKAHNFYRTVHSRRKCAYVLFRLTISALILSKMQTMSAIVPWQFHKPMRTGRVEYVEPLWGYAIRHLLLPAFFHLPFQSVFFFSCYGYGISANKNILNKQICFYWKILKNPYR